MYLFTHHLNLRKPTGVREFREFYVIGETMKALKEVSDFPGLHS